MAKEKRVFESWQFGLPLPEMFYNIAGINKDEVRTYRRTITSVLTTDTNYGGHGSTKTSALVGPVCGVLLKAAEILNGTNDGTLAISSYETDTGTSYIATYKRGDGMTEVATFAPNVKESSSSCAFKVGLLDASNVFQHATFTDTDHNVFGLALFAVMLPALLAEQTTEPLPGVTGNEVETVLSALAGKSEANETVADLCAIACDAIYRRTGHPASTAKGISEEWLINGYVGSRMPVLTAGFLQSVQCDPVTVKVAGKECELPLVTFAVDGGKKKTASTKFKDVRAEMLALGAFKPEDWPAELAAMIPVIPANDTVPKEAIEIAETYLLSKASPCPVNTFMLIGKAGSGKSTICNRYVPAVLGMPSMIYSCNADTDASELLVALQPKSDVLGPDGEILSDSKTKADRWQDLTSEEEITCDPVTAWEQLTGERYDAATSLDCWRYIATNYLSNTGGAKFVAVKSPIVRAAEAGFCCEIQELDTVRDASVVTALNSLLEEGIITMPTGEQVHRNPNSIYFFTVNQSYIGCNELNQAVYDRIQLKAYLDTPKTRELVARAKKETGCKDEEAMKKMAAFMTELEQYCNERGITDGSVGYRSFRSWVQAYMYHPKCKGDLYSSALITVMATATQNRETYDELVANVLQKTILPAATSRVRTAAAPSASITY